MGLGSIDKSSGSKWIKNFIYIFLHPVLFWRQLKHNNTIRYTQGLIIPLLFSKLNFSPLFCCLFYYTRFLFCDPITDFWVLPSRIFKFNLISVIWISSNSLFQLDFIIIFTLYTLFFLFFLIYIFFESNYKLFANF